MRAIAFNTQPAITHVVVRWSALGTVPGFGIVGRGESAADAIADASQVQDGVADDVCDGFGGCGPMHGGLYLLSATVEV